MFFFFFLESILNNMLFLCYCITVSTPTKILFILQPKSESTSLYLKILIFKNPFQIYCCLFYFTSVALHWLPASSILLWDMAGIAIQICLFVWPFVQQYKNSLFWSLSKKSNHINFWYKHSGFINALNYISTYVKTHSAVNSSLIISYVIY